MKSFTTDELRALLAEEFIGHEQERETARALMNRWLSRGDGIAVYRNQALDSQDRGARRFLSFGSPAAQLESAEPPVRMPDIGGVIGWKYVLVGTYRGANL